MQENAPNGLRPILAGIQLVLEELRDLKVEMREIKEGMLDLKKEAAEDRKQAAEDRRRADEYFRKFSEESARREKGLSQALVVIGNAGRRIIKTLDTHTVLLKQIAHSLRVSGNGRHGRGNGH